LVIQAALLDVVLAHHNGHITMGTIEIKEFAGKTAVESYKSATNEAEFFSIITRPFLKLPYTTHSSMAL